MILERLWYLIIYRLNQIDPIWWLILSCIIMGLYLYSVLSEKNSRILKILIVFVPYLLFVLASTVISRKTIDENTGMISLDITTAWTRGPGIYGGIDTYVELLMNIFMFIPLGFLLTALVRENIWVPVLVCFLITLGIETLQLITRRGFFELPDILLNMTGAFIGYGIYKLSCFLKQRKMKATEKSFIMKRQ